jgi:hypothetical protein
MGVDMSCEELADHLESCEDCRLRVVVEARLRTQPVLEPPKGLAARVLRALPRRAPVIREFARLAAAASILMGLVIGALAMGLDRHEAVGRVKSEAARVIEATAEHLNLLRNRTWKP